MRTKFIILFCGFLTWFACQAFAQSNVEIDARIYKHYDENQLREMQENTPVKILQLNFYYQKSYQLVPNGCSECPSLDPQKFDVSEWDMQRMEDKQTTRDLKYNYDVLLMSRNELMDNYKKIEAQFTANKK